MEPKRLKGLQGPESKIAMDIVAFLQARGWMVVRIVGNAYQSGLPDYFATHKNHGQRWIEIKNPAKFSFTPAQWEVLPELIKNGTGVWIMTAATEDEYKRLFMPCNLYQYLGHSKKIY